MRSNARLGFRDAMQAAGMKVAAVQSGEWELQKGNTVAAAMMREHPDLAALLCGNDTMALGAVAAVRSAGKAGKVKVVGLRQHSGRQAAAGGWPDESRRSISSRASRPRSVSKLP